MSFYWALCISQFFDVKRKDFWEMFIHHVTTIALMGFSWTCNLTRVGTLVLVIHDCADIFLEVIVYFLGRVVSGWVGSVGLGGVWPIVGTQVGTLCWSCDCADIFLEVIIYFSRKTQTSGSVFFSGFLQTLTLWTYNLTTVDTLVPVTHNCADIFLSRNIFASFGV